MLEWIISSAALTALVIALRYALRGKIGLRLQYALWGLVLLRLLIPVSFGASRLSVANALPEREAAPAVTPAAAALPPKPLTPASPRPETPPPETVEVQWSYSPYQPIGDLEEGPAVPAETAPPDTGRLLRLIWLLGACLVFLWFLGVNLGFALRLKRTRRPFHPRLDYPLRVYVTAAAETPCLFGLFRPGVYLTPAAAEDPSLGHILAHEYTHFRHGDQVWPLLRGLALALHWFDPLAWWAAALSRRDCELACDEGTLRKLGEGERTEYGRTLIRMTAARKPRLLRAATTMTGGKRSLKERIRLIAKKPKTAVLAVIILIILAAVGAACTFTGARAKGEVTEEWFIKTAWPLAEKYARGNGIAIGKEDAVVLRYADDREADVAFPAENPDKSVVVYFTRRGDGSWHTLEANAVNLVDRARWLRVEPGAGVQGANPEAVLEIALSYAQERLNEVRYELEPGLTVTAARLTGLTPMGAGTAGLTEGLELYRLEYRFRLREPEKTALPEGMKLEGDELTEWSEEGQPYLLLRWTQGEISNEWSLICATNTREIETVYGTPEMLEKYGSAYTAACAELYARSFGPWVREDRERWLGEVELSGFAASASGSYEEIGRQWAEAYAALYTHLTEDSPLYSRASAVRYCEIEAESLFSEPKELYFHVAFAWDAVDARGFSLCYTGQAGPLREEDDTAYAGWVGMEIYVKLRQEGETWICTEAGNGSGPGWGMVAYAPEPEAVKRSLEHWMGELLAGRDFSPEILFPLLPNADWTAFYTEYGEEGLEALERVLTENCVSSQRFMESEEYTRQWMTAYPLDQAYRDMYVMLAALNAWDTPCAGALGRVLWREMTAGPSSRLFAACLEKLGEERAARVRAMLEEPESASGGNTWSGTDVYRWRQELEAPVAVKASGSWQQVGEQWAEAYAARFTSLSPDNPCYSSAAEVQGVTLLAETLLDMPKRLQFIVTLVCDAADTEAFLKWGGGWYERLEGPGYGEYEGWVRLTQGVRLSLGAGGLWTDDGFFTGDWGGWGWLTYTEGAEPDFYMPLLLSGELMSDEVLFRALPFLDWTAFRGKYGQEGWDALLGFLDRTCLSEGQAYGLGDTYLDRYPEDQSYRDMYLLLAAQNARGTEYFTALNTILEKQWAADPERFVYCLNHLTWGGEKPVLADGTIRTVTGNPALYALPEPDLSPADAALNLAGLMLEDLMTEDPARTFRILEYTDLRVEVYSTAELYGEEVNVYNLSGEETGENLWIVEIRARFRWEGTLSPLGTSEGQRWADDLYQGGPMGFLLTRTEEGYTLQSRYSG